MSIDDWYAELKIERRKLDQAFPNGCCWTTSLDRFAQVAEVSNAIAARSILDNKARISTDAEVSAFHERSKQFNEKMQSQQFRRAKSDPGGVVHLIRG
jgi:hypothetical protein